MSVEFPRTKDELVALTRKLTADGFFLEHSREREINYIHRSFGRWMEALCFVTSRVSNTEKLSCLDIGASPFTFLLGSRFGKVQALDLTSALKKRCEMFGIQLFEGGVTTAGSIAGLEKVDCIFFLEVIEHVHQSPVDILKSLRGLLKPGGLLILSTPNMMCFANRVAMLFNKKLKSFTYPPFSLKDGAHGFGHDRIYMPVELRDYFEESGFQNIEILYPRHFDDLAHQNFGLLGRAKSIVPTAAKSIFPSMRDGVAVVGRQS
jgi:2-polyprenyl-3-methyl-5-hydroxy-6-metoxy-1,4-benzoquinol methylase